MDLAAHDLVRLYWYLGEALVWSGRWDELTPNAEEGLALLGDDVESVPGALMLGHLAFMLDNWGGGKVNLDRLAAFLGRLPYCPELRPAYTGFATRYQTDKRGGDALEWLRSLEEQARRHHDLRALADVHLWTGSVAVLSGDLGSGVTQCRQGLELSTRIGDPKVGMYCSLVLAGAHLSMGELTQAQAAAHRGLETTAAFGDTVADFGVASADWFLGRIYLCQTDRDQAVNAFETAVQLWRDVPFAPVKAWATAALGRAYLAQGNRKAALKHFKQAIKLAGPEDLRESAMKPLVVAQRDRPYAPDLALSGLEEAYEDPEAFHAFCRRFHEEHPEIEELPFVQWFLELAEPSAVGADPPLCDEDFASISAPAGALSSDWVWEDPFDDCSYTAQDGLEVHAANGRDLWHMNLSAPRLLRPASEGEDFTVQTVCAPAYPDRPAIGGLLLWHDKQNYLRLGIGLRGTYEISFEGCLEDEDVIIGRGRLPADRTFLRLERVSDRVNALCSADGVAWFTAGHVAFPMQGPLQVGLHAIGSIDRTVYPGAYPDGTAIRFASFTLWALDA
jgi:tetratricopeptide (TPR) repeat protein